jgi:hypothetical protein
VVKKTSEEVVGGKTESMLEEGRKYHNFFSVGCRDVFPFGKLPLEYRASREEVILN